MHPFAIYNAFNRVREEVVLCIMRFFSYHVDVTLEDDGWFVFVARARWFLDDDIPSLILLNSQVTFFCEVGNPVGYRFFMTGSAWNLIHGLEEFKDLVCLDLIHTFTSLNERFYLYCNANRKFLI